MVSNGINKGEKKNQKMRFPLATSRERKKNASLKFFAHLDFLVKMKCINHTSFFVI